MSASGDVALPGIFAQDNRHRLPHGFIDIPGRSTAPITVILDSCLSVLIFLDLITWSRQCCGYHTTQSHVRILFFGFARYTANLPARQSYWNKIIRNSVKSSTNLTRAGQLKSRTMQPTLDANRYFLIRLHESHVAAARYGNVSRRGRLALRFPHFRVLYHCSSPQTWR